MGITDYFDGYLARAQGTVSKLGVFLDPIADKIMVAAVIVMLVATGDIDGWHVIAAIISGGVFLFANIVAGAYLYLERIESRGARPAWLQRVPSIEVLDQLSYRLVAFVFPLWTFSVIAGAIWAESAWGRYWGWDPKETWAFITWVAYAAYLHARVTVGWRGRRAAWLCIFAGSTFLFNYVYVNVWGTGKHTYSGL